MPAQKYFVRAALLSLGLVFGSPLLTNAFAAPVEMQATDGKADNLSLQRADQIVSEWYSLFYAPYLNDAAARHNIEGSVEYIQDNLREESQKNPQNGIPVINVYDQIRALTPASVSGEEIISKLPLQPVEVDNFREGVRNRIDNLRGKDGVSPGGMPTSDLMRDLTDIARGLGIDLGMDSKNPFANRDNPFGDIGRDPTGRNPFGEQNPFGPQGGRSPGGSDLDNPFRQGFGQGFGGQYGKGSGTGIPGMNQGLGGASGFGGMLDRQRPGSQHGGLGSSQGLGPQGPGIMGPDGNPLTGDTFRRMAGQELGLAAQGMGSNPGGGSGGQTGQGQRPAGQTTPPPPASGGSGGSSGSGAGSGGTSPGSSGTGSSGTTGQTAQQGQRPAGQQPAGQTGQTGQQGQQGQDARTTQLQTFGRTLAYQDIQAGHAGQRGQQFPNTAEGNTARQAYWDVTVRYGGLGNGTLLRDQLIRDGVATPHQVNPQMNTPVVGATIHPERPLPPLGGGARQPAEDGRGGDNPHPAAGRGNAYIPADDNDGGGGPAGTARGTVYLPPSDDMGGSGGGHPAGIYLPADDNDNGGGGPAGIRGGAYLPPSDDNGTGRGNPNPAAISGGGNAAAPTEQGTVTGGTLLNNVMQYLGFGSTAQAPGQNNNQNNSN